MAWIKFEKDLLTDPRVLRMGRKLAERFKLNEPWGGSAEIEIGNDLALPGVTVVCGGLVRIWSLADTHIGSDDVLPLGFDELDELIGLPGFCSLLPSDWIVKIDEHSVKLPEYHKHNGTEAKKKAVTQKRVERYRKALQPRNGRALPDQDQTKTRPRHINGSSSPEISGSESSPVVETLPLLTGQQFEVRQSFVAELEPLYPKVDVPATLREMKGWLLGNPERRKTQRGIRKFITSWLQREQTKLEAH